MSRFHISTEEVPIGACGYGLVSDSNLPLGRASKRLPFVRLSETEWLLFKSPDFNGYSIIWGLSELTDIEISPFPQDKKFVEPEAWSSLQPHELELARLERELLYKVSTEFNTAIHWIQYRSHHYSPRSIPALVARLIADLDELIAAPGKPETAADKRGGSDGAL